MTMAVIKLDSMFAWTFSILLVSGGYFTVYNYLVVPQKKAQIKEYEDYKKAQQEKEAQQKALEAETSQGSVVQTKIKHAYKKRAWNYLGAKGPIFWGSLSKDYILCQDGEQQSPIDMASSKEEKALPKPHFHYHQGIAEFYNDQVEVYASLEDVGYMEYDGSHYTPYKITVRFPSEHTIDSKPYPLEFQIHHKDEQGHILIASVLSNLRYSSTVDHPAWQKIPLEMNLSPKRASLKAIEV